MESFWSSPPPSSRHKLNLLAPANNRVKGPSKVWEVLSKQCGQKRFSSHVGGGALGHRPFYGLIWPSSPELWPLRCWHRFSSTESDGVHRGLRGELRGRIHWVLFELGGEKCPLRVRMYKIRHKFLPPFSTANVVSAHVVVASNMQVLVHVSSFRLLLLINGNRSLTWWKETAKFDK